MNQLELTKAEQDSIIHYTRALFQYLHTYGSNNCPSEDGMDCAESMIRKGGRIHLGDQSEYDRGKSFIFNLSKALRANVNDPDATAETIPSSVEIEMRIELIATIKKPFGV